MAAAQRGALAHGAADALVGHLDELTPHKGVSHQPQGRGQRHAEAAPEATVEALDLALGAYPARVDAAGDKTKLLNERKHLQVLLTVAVRITLDDHGAALSKSTSRGTPL